jgi:hypothetical protein
VHTLHRLPHGSAGSPRRTKSEQVPVPSVQQIYVDNVDNDAASRPRAYGLFYKRAEDRTFRPPVAQKQKQSENAKKIVEISLASRPWSQPQRHARLPHLYNFAVGGAFAPNSPLLERWHDEARRKIALRVIAACVQVDPGPT